MIDKIPVWKTCVLVLRTRQLAEATTAYNLGGLPPGREQSPLVNARDHPAQRKNATELDKTRTVAPVRLRRNRNGTHVAADTAPCPWHKVARGGCDNRHTLQRRGRTFMQPGMKTLTRGMMRRQPDVATTYTDSDWARRPRWISSHHLLVHHAPTLAQGKGIAVVFP